MSVTEILLLGVALSMDAVAVGMTDGMSMKKFSNKRAVLIALFFGIFQAAMPLIGYFIADMVASSFQSVFEKFASVVAFALLAFLGAKMIVDAVKEYVERKRAREYPVACKDCDTVACPVPQEKDDFSFAKLLMQAVATSIDALAVGVSMKMATMVSGELALGIFGSVGAIGVITFVLSFIAVHIGKAIGNKLADKAELVGGIVLILIGLKLLLEGIL